MSSERVLVVEDEPAIRQGLCDALASQGYQVEAVGRGRAGLEAALGGTYALVVLDVMLPELDGLSICAEVREQRPRQAILMLTAKGGEQDVLDAFRCGADDYVTKPFSLAQLLARVAALVRRAVARTEAVEAPFDFGPLRVDPAVLRGSCGTKQTALNRRDVELLAYFAAHPQRVVGRVELLEAVWGFGRGGEIETRCIDMHLVKLRRKLALACGAVGERLIETVRGEGYRFDLERVRS